MCENWDKICRMCLNEDSELKSLFLNYDNGFIPDFITESLSLQIFKGDDLPQNICNECTTKVTSIHENRKLFIENDHKLRKILTKDGHSEFVEVKFELDVDHFVNENDGHTKEEDSLKTNDSPSKSGGVDSQLIPKTDQNDAVEEDDCFADGDEDCGVSDDETVSESDWDEEEIKPLRGESDVSEKKKINTREKKRKIRKPKPEHFPRLNDHKCYICGEKCEMAQNLSDHLSKHLDKLPYTCKDCVMEKILIKSLTTLNVHLKMHAQPVKCDYCDKRYSSVQNRNLHVRNYHLSKDGEKTPVQCELCAKVCPSQGSYKIHMKYHSNEIQCKICNKSFGTQRNLKRHVLTHTEEKAYECSICNNKYCDINSYNVHIKRHNNERAHECQLCSAKFIMSSDLNYHMKVHQSDSEFQPKRNLKEFYTVKVVDGVKQYHCNLCVKSFHRSANMTSHVSTHFKTRQCSYCGQRFKNGRALSDHENTHTGAKPYVCKTCGKGFANNTNLYQHHKIHRGVKN